VKKNGIPTQKHPKNTKTKPKPGTLNSNNLPEQGTPQNNNVMIHNKH
jgi:hypothetical protein